MPCQPGPPRAAACVLLLLFAAVPASVDAQTVGATTAPSTKGGTVLRKNLLMLIVDDLRNPSLQQRGKQGTTSFGGSAIHTPHIDRFLTKSTWFTNAQSQMSYCAASRASFMTGKQIQHVLAPETRALA